MHVVVLGGTGPLGGALARAYAGTGAHVVVADLDEAAAKDLAASLGGTGAQVDVRDLASVQALAARVKAELGAPGIVVSATLSDPDPRPWQSTDLAAWTAVRGTDVNGAVHAQLAFLPDLLVSGGRLVFSTTMAGYLPAHHPGPIGAAHAALIAIAEVARVDLARTKVSVGLVCLPTDLAQLGLVTAAAARGDAFLAAAPATEVEAEQLRARHGALRAGFDEVARTS